MVYDGSRDAHSVERLALVGDLRRGLETGEVFPLYQPQCNALTGEVVGVEALARWRHSQAGILTPGEFLEVAESAGMLDSLTDVLLAQSLEALRGWHRAGHEITLSINISPRTMRDPGFVDRVRAALQLAGVDPKWLTLEITEYVMLTDPAGSIRELERLRRLGCRIAVDDFGTGYSSISYLKQLPVDELKIDQSFVAQLGENPKDEVIVSAVIDLGHRMGFSVTAEGVETEAAWALLAALGCDVVQGYRLARPLTADAVGAWLTHRTESPAVPARSRLKAL
jgi:EAL domain-containing protein (putative c-di-GMP-specific phosphodiesterase class I)